MDKSYQDSLSALRSKAEEIKNAAHYWSQHAPQTIQSDSVEGRQSVEEIFGKYSVQCSTMLNELKPPMNHFVLVPKPPIDKTINVPELFRTMLLQEIIKQDIKISKDFEEKHEQMEITTDEKLKIMEDDIKNYNETCESVEKMFALKRKSLGNYQKKKPVPIPDTKPMPLISALLLGTELQYLPAVATPISISSPAPISIPSPNIREVTQIPTPTNIPPPVAAAVIPSPLVPTPINVNPIPIITPAPVVPTIPTNAPTPITSQFAPGPQMPVPSHIPTNPFNTIIRPPIIPGAGNTAPAFARTTGTTAAAPPAARARDRFRIPPK